MLLKPQSKSVPPCEHFRQYLDQLDITMDFDAKTAVWYFVVFIFSALFFLQHARTAISWAINHWQWLKYVCYLRGLPSPPRHWLLGHISEVS